MFGRKPKLLLDLETDPDVKVSATYKEYYERLEKRLKYLQKVLLDFKMRQLALFNKDWEYFQYNSGRFSIFNITIDKSIKNHVQEDYGEICWTLGSI